MFGMMSPTLIAAAVSLAIGFGGGWVSNGWRLHAEIAQMQTQEAINLSNGLRDALDKTTRYQRTKDEALKKAESRAAANAASASAARTESDVLRQQLEASSTGIPQATHDSLARYTTTLSAVFGECQAAATGLAEKATGHASDIRKLSESWPTDEAK